MGLVGANAYTGRKLSPTLSELQTAVLHLALLEFCMQCGIRAGCFSFSSFARINHVLIILKIT